MSLSDKDFRVPAIGIIDNIVLSKNSAWAYYILSEKEWDYLGLSEKIEVQNRITGSLSSLCKKADDFIDGHILITNVPFNTNSWREQIESSIGENRTRAFNRYMRNTEKDLNSQKFEKRITFLGIKLYDRRSFDFRGKNILEFGVKDVFRSVWDSVKSFTSFEGEEITEKEENRARGAEKDLYRTLLSGDLHPVKATPSDLLASMKKRFYPNMDHPYLEYPYTEVDHKNRIGLSDMMVETSGEIEVRPRYIKFRNFINGELQEGCRATVSISKFPSYMGFSGNSISLPFFYREEVFGRTVSSRFVILPINHMNKELDKKKADTKDEIRNLSNSDMDPTTAIYNTYRDMNNLEDQLENDKSPWVSGAYRITVEGEDEEDLKNKIEDIKQEYSYDDIVLTWSSGDQLDLLREELFGGELYVNSFNHTTTLNLLSVSGFNFGSDVGDDIKQSIQYRK